jgi:hypothetical protein
MVKLDVQPLYKSYDAVIGNYDTIVHGLAAAGVQIQFMESNAVPGDPCAANCPDTCTATPGSAADSCTPSYMDTFHGMLGRLFARYPALPLGVSYDVEQSSRTSGDHTVVWAALVARINAFTSSSKHSRGALFTGYSVIRPAIWDFSLNTTFLTQARSLDDQVYFSTATANWGQPGKGGPIDRPDGIKAQLALCQANAERPTARVQHTRTSTLAVANGNANGNGNVHVNVNVNTRVSVGQCSTTPYSDGCPCGHKWDCASGVCAGTPATCGTSPSPSPPSPSPSPTPTPGPTPGPTPTPTPTPGNCKVVMGFETSAEDESCKT